MSQGAKDAKFAHRLTQFRSVSLLAVGANYPSVSSDVAETIQMGIGDIQRALGVIRSRSRFYRTPAFPPGAGPDFINAALVLETNLAPSELLAELHEIEAAYGRTREKRWGARTLDLDLIFFDDLVLPDMETFRHWAGLPLAQQSENAPDCLVLPHPRVQDRGFVLVPAAEIAPDWRHPVLKRTIAELCADLPEALRNEVRPL